MTNPLHGSFLQEEPDDFASQQYRMSSLNSERSFSSIGIEEVNDEQMNEDLQKMEDDMKESTKEHRPISRLEIYSDALFSIIATINILPLMEKLKEVVQESTEGEEEKEEDGEPVNYFQLFGAYCFTFIAICYFYRLHHERLNRVRVISPKLIAANTLLIALLGLFPFTSGLFNYAETFWPTVMNIFLVYACYMMGMVTDLYVNYYTTQDLRLSNLHVRLTKDPQNFRNYAIPALCCTILVSIFVAISLVLCYYHYNIGVFFVCVLPFVIRLFLILLNKFVDKTGQFDGERFSIRQKRIQQKNSFKQFSSERVNAFSDGIFAITVTLVAVNLRVQDNVVCDSTDPSGEHCLDSAVRHMLADLWPQYISYIFSFVFVGMAWYWCYKMFELVHYVRTLIFYVNCIFLMFIGCFPAFVQGSFVDASLHDPNADVNEYPLGLGLLCLQIVSTSLLQSLLWTLIYLTAKKKSASHMVVKRNVILMYIGILFNGVFAIFALIITVLPVPVQVAYGFLLASPPLVILLFLCVGGFHHNLTPMYRELYLSSDSI